MRTVPCVAPVFFDVDDTLVKWGFPIEEGDIPVTCPAHEYMFEGSKCHSPEWMEMLRPHKRHIEELKMLKANGHTIIVWSQAGWVWAEAVIKALQLEDYVDLVIEKPYKYFDDLDCKEFMTNRGFYEDKDN